MTRDELKARIKMALSTHLGSSEWNELGSARQEGAVDMAISDVFCRLRGVGMGNADRYASDLVSACAEQAIFLGLNYGAKKVGSATGAIASESVDGASVSYVTSGDSSDGNISARAKMYIDLLNRSVKACVRIVR